MKGKPQINLVKTIGSNGEKLTQRLIDKINVFYLDKDKIYLIITN